MFNIGGNEPLNSYESTIGIDIHHFNFNEMIGYQRNAKLQIWDTSGDHRFDSIIRSYFRSANYIIMIYTGDVVPNLYNIERYILTYNAELILVRNVSALENIRINTLFKLVAGDRQFLRSHPTKLNLNAELVLRLVSHHAELVVKTCCLRRLVVEDNMPSRSDRPMADLNVGLDYIHIDYDLFNKMQVS